MVTWGHPVCVKEKVDWDASAPPVVQTVFAVTGFLAAHFNSSFLKLAFFLPNPWRLLVSADKSRFKAIGARETPPGCGSVLCSVFDGLSQKCVFGSQLGYSVAGTTLHSFSPHHPQASDASPSFFKSLTGNQSYNSQFTIWAQGNDLHLFI